MVVSNYDTPGIDGRRIVVAIADDCPAMREGLGRLIADECSLAVVSSAATTAELRRLVQAQPLDALILELTLEGGDGLALIKDLVGLRPGLKIVVFTLQPEEIYATRCLQAGARAFVSKREQVMTLFRAVHQVVAGGVVVPARVTAELFGPGRAAGPGPTGLVAPLTDRELQVFRLVGLAQPTREVARRLGVSIKTVESHRENIKNKLGLDCHAELVARAAQWLRDSSGA